MYRVDNMHVHAVYVGCTQVEVNKGPELAFMHVWGIAITTIIYWLSENEFNSMHDNGCFQHHVSHKSVFLLFCLCS